MNGALIVKKNFYSQRNSSSDCIALWSTSVNVNIVTLCSNISKWCAVIYFWASKILRRWNAAKCNIGVGSYFERLESAVAEALRLNPQLNMHELLWKTTEQPVALRCTVWCRDLQDSLLGVRYDTWPWFAGHLTKGDNSLFNLMTRRTDLSGNEVMFLHRRQPLLSVALCSWGEWGSLTSLEKCTFSMQSYGKR